MIGVGLLLYLGKSGILNFRALARLSSAWPITLVALALLLLDITMMALRQSWLFRPHRMHLPLGRSVLLTLVGQFFGTFLPGAAGGDLAKVYYAVKENSGKRSEIVMILALDRAIGLFSLLLLPLLFAPFFADLLRRTPVLRNLLVMVGLAAAGMLTAFLASLFSAGLVRRWTQGAPGFLRGKEFVGRLLGAISTYRHSPEILAGALGLSLAANFSVVVITGLAVLALDPAGVAAKMVLVIPIGHIVNSVPFTPGGLGVGEAAFSALFGLAGLRRGAEALLCWRLWTVIAGLPGLLFYLRGVGRVVYDAKIAAGSAT